MLHVPFVPSVFLRLIPRLSLLPVLLAGLLLPAGARAQICDFQYFLSATAPSTVSAGVPFSVTVTVTDSCGQVAPGTDVGVDFYSSDPSAVLPPGMNGLPAGVGVFQVVLQTPGTQSITAGSYGDVCNPDLPCPSVSINVLATPPVVVASEGSVKFGSLATGSTSEAQALNFSILAGTTVGSIAVLTQGAPNQDFTEAPGSTCTATTYSSATNCAVNVIFTPKAAGLRMGAVVFFAGAGNTGAQLASVPIYGVGTGPQVAYGPGAATAINRVANGSGLSYPEGVAVDGLGNLFIADGWEDLDVVETPAGGGAATAISPVMNGMGLYDSMGLTVDGAGDLLIASTTWLDFVSYQWNYGSEVVEVPSGGGFAKVIFAGLNLPTGVAVDGAGDVFIADSWNNRVVEAPAGGGAAITIAPTVNGVGLNAPFGVAVDSAGDLFTTDAGNNRVVEVPGGGGAPIAIDPEVNGESLSNPQGLAVDAAGDLFVVDTNNNRVVEIPAGGGAPIAIAPIVNGLGFNAPIGIAVDGTGNLFITDSNNRRVVKIQRSLPPAVNFPTATLPGSIDTTDGTQTVQIQNIGNEALDFTGLSYPADFSEASGDADACASSTSLNAGQECDLPIDFTPKDYGAPLSEEVVLTDDALNASGTQQSIAVTGTTGLGSDTLYLPAPGTVLNGPEVTFTWTPRAGATGYSLWIGTTGAGSDNLYTSHETAGTSATAAGLPTNGETVYVRLYTTSGKVTVHSDYTFTASTRAAVTAPAAGSVLAGASETFSWTASAGATGYSLWLGSTGPGSDDLYDSHETTGTSVTAKGLPTNGETIYARLYTTYGKITSYNDSTYTAQ